eukprot:scaffold5818_cov84-Cylindrotheca_fusiformis.AAC.3
MIRRGNWLVRMLEFWIVRRRIVDDDADAADGIIVVHLFVPTLCLISSTDEQYGGLANGTMWYMVVAESKKEAETFYQGHTMCLSSLTPSPHRHEREHFVPAGVREMTRSYSQDLCHPD